MKQKLQKRINQVRQMAKTPTRGNGLKPADSICGNDSLSKSIRNSKEANVFLAELEAAIRMAQKKMDHSSFK